jgi:uncharacterized phage infection (PIP) family protein YhgE
MTTASIKNTADLAKESDSRKSGETPEIKTTSSPGNVGEVTTKAPKSNAKAGAEVRTPESASKAEDEVKTPESASTVKTAGPDIKAPESAKAPKTAKPEVKAPEIVAAAITTEPDLKAAEPTKTEEPESPVAKTKNLYRKETEAASIQTALPEEAGSPDQAKAKPAPKLPPEPATAEQVAAYSDSLNKLSFKNTIKLYELRGYLNRAKKSLTEPESEIAAKVIEMLSKIEALLDQNKVHQEQLNSNTESLLEGLKKFLEDGQSHEALPAWDKIQGNISNTSGKTRADLQEKANAYKTKINELRDWKMMENQPVGVHFTIAANGLQKKRARNRV